MIPHPFELHSHSEEVELPQTRHIGIESLLGARLYLFAYQVEVHPRGAFADHLGDVLVFLSAHHQHILADVLIQGIVATLVTHIEVEVFYLGVYLPFVIPQFGHGHSDIHHPAKAGHGIVAVLTRTVGDI